MKVPGLVLVATLLLPAVTAATDAGQVLVLADGVPMAYVDRGQGEPAVVFVHCGNCRKEIWDETLAAFGTSHRVVAMDLPGHGRSGAGRTTWSLPALGADVAALVDHLKLGKVILVGNSLGGPVSLEAARRLGPGRVLGVVAVDTLHDVEREWPEEAWRRQLDAYRKDFPTACTELMLRLLPRSAPAATRQRVDRETCDNDPAAAVALLETLHAYDTKAALRDAGVPVWAINSSGLPSAPGVNRRYAKTFELFLMDGVGHYPQVERPAEFQAHLRLAVDAMATVPEPVQQFLKSASLMRWSPEQQRVGYPILEKLVPTGLVPRADEPLPLPTKLRDWSGFRYAHAGRRRSIDEFMTDMNVAGVLVLHDGAVVLERYAAGHSAAQRWPSFSVAKSVTSLLVGAALHEGAIKTLDDPVSRYVAALAGSAYDAVSIRHLLQMSSGVQWNEDPVDPASDLAETSRLSRDKGHDAVLAFLAKKPRAAAAGSTFNYNTVETDLVGAVVREAVGRPLATYLGEKIWRPFGMETDAYWLKLAGTDSERGGCCISATLRDLGRLGLFTLAEAQAPPDRRVLPDGWMRDSTRPSTTRKDYGYSWWLREGGRYFASGAFGQHVEVDPASRVVVAIQSAWPKPFDHELITHNDTFVDALFGEVTGSAKR
jgi:CubicO group peptidase (beta-lactamase class C family)/pimeloyl-ACP methyl ester carboxylesterase